MPKDHAITQAQLAPCKICGLPPIIRQVLKNWTVQCLRSTSCVFTEPSIAQAIETWNKMQCDPAIADPAFHSTATPAPVVFSNNPALEEQERLARERHQNPSARELI